MKVEFSFGGSHALRTQLEQGLQADVFASADQRQMDLAAAAGLLGSPPASFATNRLVVIVPSAAVHGAVRVRRLPDLAQPGLATGFYEWRKDGARKTPMRIVLKSRKPFGFAGLWDEWTDKATGLPVRSCNIITAEPNELVAGPASLASAPGGKNLSLSHR